MDLDDPSTRKKFHRCDICFYRTKSISLIINHEREHRKISNTFWEVFNCSSELNEYKCGECDYQTFFKVNSTRHVCSSNQQDETDFVKTYICENCDFLTSSCLMLGKHVYRDCKNVINNNWDQMTVLESCENNDESEENIDHFKKEIMETEDKDEAIKIEWYCGYCFFKTELKRDLRKHIDQQHLFIEKSNILNKSNNDTHTTKEIKWFKCKNCTFQTKRKCSLNIHILSKHTAPEKIEWFKCDKCSFQSKRKGNLTTHILLKHTVTEKIKWFKCKKCLFQSKLKTSLNKHIRVRHAASEKIKLFKCKNCSYQCKWKSYLLNRHILSKHTPVEKIEWFKCEKCSFETTHKRSFNRHILSEHIASEKIQWFKCKSCSYKCKQKYQLNQHIMAKHTAPEKIKWFKCYHCSHQSKRKDHLKSHILRKHSKQMKRFNCNSN